MTSETRIRDKSALARLQCAGISARVGALQREPHGGHTDDSLRNRSSFRNRNAPGPYVKTCCSARQKVEPPLAHIMAIQLTTDP